MAAPNLDAAQLVAQMLDTLSSIHAALTSLNTSEHDAKLDDLEANRDTAINQLLNHFAEESMALTQKRMAEREGIAERRRKEDEERERRRRQEDEVLAEQERLEDEARDGKLLVDTNDVEEETDNLMSQVEEEAQKFIEEGQKKLQVLEEKRRKLNYLIEEQLKAPSIPSLPRRSRRGSGMPPPSTFVMSPTPSKPPELYVAPSESVSNPEVKAFEPQLLQHIVHAEQSMPQADMEAAHSHVDHEEHHSDTPSDSRPISQHERPLLVQPVISRSGDIIRTEEEMPQAKVYTPVEQIGVLTAEDFKAAKKKLDIAWWDNKKREEAEEALRAEIELSRKRGELDANPLPAHDEAALGAPTVVEEEKLQDREMALETADEGVMDVTPAETRSLDGEHVQEVGETGEPRHSEHMQGQEPVTKDAHEETVQVTLSHDQAVELNTHIHPADVPLPLTGSREGFWSEVISSESAQGHHNYPEIQSPVMTIQATATTDHHFSEAEVDSSAYSHSNWAEEEIHQPEGRVAASDAAKVALPPDMGDSCSLSDRSQADHVHLVESSSIRHAEIYAADDEDVEFIAPLERVVSHYDENPDSHHGDYGIDEYLHSAEPDQMVDGQRSPVLESIHESEAAQKLNAGVGIYDHYQEQDHHEANLTTTEEHDDDCGCADPEANEDRIRQTDIYPQPFQSNRGPLVGDGDVPQLADDIGGRPVRDAEPNGGDRGLIDDYPADGVSSELVDARVQDRGAGAGEDVERAESVVELEQVEGVRLVVVTDTVDHAAVSILTDKDAAGDAVAQDSDETPLASAGLRSSNVAGRGTEESLAEQLRRASVALSLVEMEEGYTTTVYGEDGLFDQDGEESDEVSDIEETYMHVDEDGQGDSRNTLMGGEPVPTENAHADEGSVQPATKTKVWLPFQPEALEVDEIGHTEMPQTLLSEESEAVETDVPTITEAPVLTPSPLAKVEVAETLPHRLGTYLPSPAQAEHVGFDEAKVQTPIVTSFEQQSFSALVANAMVDGAHLQPASPLPAIEVVSSDRALRTSTVVSKADEFFDDDDDQDQHDDQPETLVVQQPQSNLEAEPQYAAPDAPAQQHDTEPRHPTSPLMNRGFADSRHNPERPQTPEQQLEDFTPRDVTNVPWQHPSHTRQNSGSSPQSMRSQSTLSSGSSSPEHTDTIGDAQDPVIRGLVSTRSPSYHTSRPRNDSSLTDTEYNPGHSHADSGDAKGPNFIEGPLPRWQPRDSHVPETTTSRPQSRKGGDDAGSGGGSLFQRMRSVFEQQSSSHHHNTNTRPVSTGGGLWGGHGPVSSNRGSKTFSNFDAHKSHRQRHSSSDGKYYSRAHSQDDGGDYEESADERSGLLTSEN